MIENPIKIALNNAKKNTDIVVLDADIKVLHSKKVDILNKALSDILPDLIGKYFCKDHNEDNYETTNTNIEYIKILSMATLHRTVKVLSIKWYGSNYFELREYVINAENLQYWDVCDKAEFTEMVKKIKQVLK